MRELDKYDYAIIVGIEGIFALVVYALTIYFYW